MSRTLADVLQLALDRQAHKSWFCLTASSEESGCRAAVVLNEVALAVDRSGKDITDESYGPYFLFNHGTTGGNAGHGCRCVDFSRNRLAGAYKADSVQMASRISSLLDSMYSGEFGDVSSSLLLHYRAIWDDILDAALNRFGERAGGVKTQPLRFEEPQDFLDASKVIFMYLWTTASDEDDDNNDGSGTDFSISRETFDRIRAANSQQPEDIEYLCNWSRMVKEGLSKLSFTDGALSKPAAAMARLKTLVVEEDDFPDGVDDRGPQNAGPS
ncbi:hypothetical protein JX266_005858 [Neoarthrinium moseri]|nr:hypothetical protein JX266_005858 [Neoarthrinium moseri]